MKPANTQKPLAAIFDMDGLMLETEGPLFPLWKIAGKQFGYTITDELIIQTVGLNTRDIRALCKREMGGDFPYDELHEVLVKLIAEEFAKGIAHKAGLLTLLDHLKARGIPLAVGTSTRRAAAIKRLEQTGIADRFSHLACGDEVSHGKPFPDIFLLAAEKLNVPPARCVGFEDSPAGLQALAAAGIPSVFIRDIVEPPKEILDTIWKRFDTLDQAAVLFG